MLQRTGYWLCLVASMALVGTVNADLTSDLAGLWTFEDAGNLADDISPYDNDGTIELDSAWGSNISQGPGVIGLGAAEFFTTNDLETNHYIEIPNAPQLNGTSQTVSYWIKTTQQDVEGTANGEYVDHIRHSGHMSFKATGQYDVPGGWAPITFDSGGGFGNSFHDNNVGENTWNTDYADGEWHHIVTVYDETTNTLKTWIDLELVIDQVQDHLAGGLNPSTESLKFGGYEGGFGNSLIGSMDQIRIYDVAKGYEVDADGTLIGGDLYEMYNEIPEPTSLLLVAVGGLLIRRR